ncbi:MAG: hypothetical protein Q9217_003981 [Psora testacea]
MTPEKASLNKNASPQTVSSSEKPVSTTKAKEVSINEPSPASTYGDTAGSSTPATPLETGGNDITSGITHSMRAVQLGPAIKSISGSPMSAHDTKYRSTSAHHTANVTFSELHSSPSKVVGSRNINRASPTSSPPSSGRVQAIRSAPTWRGGQGDNFVHTSLHGADDPFVSGEDTQQSRLTQSDTDDQLEYAVTQAFQQFGNVYVKIRRDGRQMPYAFAQYTNVEDAQRAITLGRGRFRPQKNRVALILNCHAGSLYLSKINGGAITEEEAHDIMSGYGPIEMHWFASQTEREMFGLPEGIFVRFAFFDDCRNAQMASMLVTN